MFPLQQLQPLQLLQPLHLLVLPPFIDPLSLNLFEVFLGGAVLISGEVWYLQNPRQQVREANAVDAALVEFITETVVEGHGDVFVVGPAEGEIVEIFETQGGSILVLWYFSHLVCCSSGVALGLTA